ncbi:MAG TPA: FHA domain-containing protein [Acidimicrobiales bacterium]
MPVTCPAGHTSTSTDYCDTCGAAIEAVPAGPALTTEATVPDTGVISPCPNCGSPAGVDDAFCEVCGIDFATGELPTQPHKAVDPAAVPAAPATPDEIVAAAAAGTAAPPAAPAATAPVGWSVLVEADRTFYEGNESPDVDLPFPASAPPREVPLKSGEVLIGRRSDSRGVFPDVDLGVPNEDPGVSRRHAVLRHKPDDSWVVIDQGSTNGTRVSGTSAPVAPGEERPLLNGDQLLLGAWTRITLKRS